MVGGAADLSKIKGKSYSTFVQINILDTLLSKLRLISVYIDRSYAPTCQWYDSPLSNPAGVSLHQSCFLSIFSWWQGPSGSSRMLLSVPLHYSIPAVYHAPVPSLLDYRKATHLSLFLRPFLTSVLFVLPLLILTTWKSQATTATTWTSRCASME